MRLEIEGVRLGKGRYIWIVYEGIVQVCILSNRTVCALCGYEELLIAWLTKAGKMSGVKEG